MRDMIEGSTRNASGTLEADGKMYSCDNDKIDCMSPKISKSINLTGLAKIIEEELTKDDGIIFKYARDDGTLQFTEQQKAILSNMPAEIAVGFRNMSLGSEDAAKSMAPEGIEIHRALDDVLAHAGTQRHHQTNGRWSDRRANRRLQGHNR